MKKLLQTLLVVVIGILSFQTAHAQMPDGSTAPDWTKTDIDGNEHTLYDYLDDGYTVILDFYATWCGPCWSYHNEGILEEIWAAHGPAGMDGVNDDTTDDIMIFAMEGDDDTTLDDLNGTGGNTTGDWVSSTVYPIIDDVYDLFQEYQCTYYPTIYTVCPSRLTSESGQASYNNHLALADAPTCGPAAEGIDGALNSYNGATVSCGTVEVLVDLVNTGVDNLTSATITVNGCDNCPFDYMWTGDLETWEIEEVNCGTANVSGTADLDIEITSTDLVPENNEVSATISPATAATTQWFLDIEFDCWSEEVTWDVKDSGGSSVANGNYGQGESEANETFNVGALGCYQFTIYDGYGDGLYGSQYNGCDIDGTWTLHTEMGTIGSYDASGGLEYEELEAGADAQVVSINEMAGVNVVWNVFPNPTDAKTNVQFSLDNATGVVIEVYNTLGQKVLSQNLGTLTVGQYTEVLDLSSQEAGMYLVNLNANGNVSTQRVTLR